MVLFWKIWQIILNLVTIVNILYFSLFLVSFILIIAIFLQKNSDDFSEQKNLFGPNVRAETPIKITYYLIFIFCVIILALNIVLQREYKKNSILQNNRIYENVVSKTTSLNDSEIKNDEDIYYSLKDTVKKDENDIEDIIVENNENIVTQENDAHNIEDDFIDVVKENNDNDCTDVDKNDIVNDTDNNYEIISNANNNKEKIEQDVENNDENLVQHDEKELKNTPNNEQDKKNVDNQNKNDNQENTEEEAPLTTSTKKFKYRGFSRSKIKNN